MVSLETKRRPHKEVRQSWTSKEIYVVDKTLVEMLNEEQYCEGVVGKDNTMDIVHCVALYTEVIKCDA